MMLTRIIPPDVSRVQIDAADPDFSAFVSANAGSGKTYVLAQRVINLLLRGVDPAKILCITFTKTAAANMANEVFKRLASWTALDDAAIDEQIRLSTGKTPNAGERARARRLFASALETPGGLKVQTSTPSARGCCISSLSRPTLPRVLPYWMKPRLRNCSIS